MHVRRFVGIPTVVFLLALGCQPGRDESTETPRHDAAVFYDTVSVRGGSFSADEDKILITTDETGTYNVYAQPLDGGARSQLTDSTTDSTFSVSYFPEDDRFLYTADQGGNELNHLYVRELDGSSLDLTPGENLKANFAGWSGDYASFHVLSNERDPRYFDLYRYSTDGYERLLVYENTDGYFVSGVSDDGKWLALNKLLNNSDSDVYLYDFATGSVRHVTPHEGDVSNSFVTFNPDSSVLYYSTNGEGEFRQIWSYDLETEERGSVMAADWDVSSFAFSETGRYQVSATNEDGETRIAILDTVSGESVDVPELGAGDLRRVSFSRSETKMLFLLNSDTAPSNIFVLDLEADGEPVQLTDSLTEAIAREDLVESEVVRFASYDGLEIPGLLYRPHSASAENPVPALLMMHGGPGGQSRKGYSARTQHLVNHGYAIFAVNNRGSSGYGKTFHHMDDRKHGEVDLQDCVWARRYLETLDWVDGDKIGIMGGSYGGYLVAAALAFEPDVFDVGVDIFGVTNWIRTLESIPPWWTAQRDSLYAELGDPATDRERLHRISPLFHAANIKKPLFVVQGKNDPRVLQVESDELVEAVRAKGVPVEYLIFDDEGHGFTKKANRIAASEAYLSFLDRYLAGDDGPAS